ncbi:hypothetical protein Golax_020117 [Gossypium laxum]|uniref:Uncharacterized protein n=1 Tax=Gossypium laxum TaxID=34288 RepID=A0A7J8Z8I9_9ROSI|nr:hypothetical protein [Gossypium laxum]
MRKLMGLEGNLGSLVLGEKKGNWRSWMIRH